MAHPFQEERDQEEGAEEHGVRQQTSGDPGGKGHTKEAEGIEHLEQVEILQNLGCEFGQGFYFAKPLNKEDMNDFLLNANLKEKLVYPGNLVNQESSAAIEIELTQ